MTNTVAAGLIALAAAAEPAAVTASEPRTDLTAAMVEIALAPPASPKGAARCFVVVEGLTAQRPVGTAYALSIAAPGETPLPVGAISFFEAIGQPLGASGPLSFEIPARYCTAQGAVAQLRPLRRPNPDAHPAIGRVVLAAL